MSKSVASSKESGAHAFGKNNKNHEKPCYAEGAQDRGKHEKPCYSEGGYVNAKKTIVHVEDVAHHSGRPLPEETKLADSKIITKSGRLAKRNE
jgi:hypothetical protein